MQYCTDRRGDLLDSWGDVLYAKSLLCGRGGGWGGVQYAYAGVRGIHRPCRCVR